MPEHSYVHVVSYADSREAERGAQMLRRSGFGVRLFVEEEPPPPAFHLWVLADHAADALARLQAEDAQADAEPATKAVEAVACPRCASESGVVVGDAPGWQRTIFQGVFGVPHLKRPCRCQSCGHEWRQFTST